MNQKCSRSQKDYHDDTSIVLIETGYWRYVFLGLAAEDDDAAIEFAFEQHVIAAVWLQICSNQKAELLTLNWRPR